MYDAFIFDLDGTLTDSKRGILACARYALDKMGRQVPGDDVLQRFLGPPLAESFMNYCAMTHDEAELATAYYRERYIPVGWRENAVFKGIRALLAALKARGAYLAVATGKPEHTSIDILHYYGLLQYFDAVAGPRDADLHADKGELIARVLPKGKKAVMIGDCVGDIKGAQNQGIDSVAALYGYDSEERLLRAQPTHAVKDVQALQVLLTGKTCAQKGWFLSVEGLDGCGKTTQLAALRQLLEDFGFEVHVTREPGGCAVSEAIRAILLAKKENGMCAQTEALLFAASRAQHVREVILPAVQRGEAVLCDRFVDSSIAYQGAGRGLGMDAVRSINTPAVAGAMPDVTVLLKIDHATSLARRVRASNPDRIEQQDNAFFARVEAAYESLATAEPDRFLVVDATGSVAEVEAALHDRLLERLKERGML